MQSSTEVWLHIICIFLVLSFTIFYCIYAIVSQKMSIYTKFISVVVLLCAMYVALNRNTYLPFLGYTALPPSMFLDVFEPRDATQEIVLDVDAPDGTKVVYWAANNSKKDAVHVNPMVAYSDYSNSGIAVVMKKKAVVRFRCPDKYKAGMSIINKHIHYRLVVPNSPLMSPVYTKYVYC